MNTSDFETLKNINLYEILHINSKNDFTPELAKKNYRKLALKYHPDKNHMYSDKFDLIQLAYIVLSDPNNKEQYDNIYDENLSIKSFVDLKDMNNKMLFKYEKLSDEEFKQRIEELNKKLELDLKSNNDDFKTQKREIYEQEISEKFRQEQEQFKGLNDKEKKEKFDELFKQQQNEFNTNTPISDLTVFNVNNGLTIGTVLNNMSYDSMFSKTSLYEDLFKLNNPGTVYVDNNKSLEERINDYKMSTNDLFKLAKNIK